MQEQTTPQPPAPTATDVQQIVVRPGSEPSAVYEAFRAQRSELSEQLERLEERRGELAEQLRDPMTQGADRAGLEQRIKELDTRISQVEQQIAGADANVAQAAAVPGAVIEEPPPPPDGPPEEVVAMGLVFTTLVLFPLAIAYARRIWKRGTAVATSLPRDLMERFTRLEQSVDSIALEVERIGEGQRFMTRIFTDHPEARALAASAAQPLEVRAPEGAAQPRR